MEKVLKKEDNIFKLTLVPNAGKVVGFSLKIAKVKSNEI